jgi:beta-glucosidase
MTRVQHLCTVLICMAVITANAQQPKPVPGTDQSMNSFISNLMKKMTLEEKIGQLNLLTSDMDVTGPTMRENYRQDIISGRCGNIFNAYSPKFIRQLQEMALQTRLKIPLLFGYDVIHGHKTIFPIPLGESCSWDLPLLEKTARIAAIEATADGLHWTYSPMVDIVRDPRWGRVAESGGEDPWLGSKIAIAKVKGYQQADLSNIRSIMACVKHFALYGAAQAGRDYNTVDMSRRQMFETYLPPYKAAVDAGVGTVMSSFNEIDGIPATANRWLLTDLLRKQWGFKGFVVTDYTSINEMLNHGIGATEAEVGMLAIDAGVDMDMQGAVFYNHLKDLVAQKKVSMATVDQAVQRVLEAKYRLGLFKDPFRGLSEERAAKEIMSKENLEVALDAARHSMVLLKNQDHALPLKKSGSIALVGPLAADRRNMIGNWSAAGDWNLAVSIKDALEKYASSNGIKLNYAKGANIVEDTVLLQKLNRFGGNIVNDSAMNAEQLVKQATDLAATSDVIIAVLGESQGMTGEAASRSDIGLPSSQKTLLEALVKTGKPVILVLINGRPLTLQWEDDHVAAILEAWFPGTQAGNAVVDILSGAYNPSGKLTMTFPRTVGQIPLYYAAKNTGRPMDPNNKYTSKYLDVPNTPLYPFGFGLSYSDFTYSDVTIDKTTMRPIDKLNVQVTVSNNSEYDGEETVQLYIRDMVASITRPVKELRGFSKVFLKKGESKQVNFTLGIEDLKFYDKDLNWIFEPGDFKVFVGGNSRDVKEATFKLMK